MERKGQTPYATVNTIGYMILTNNENPIKILHDDRRFTGIECCNKLANNKNYFTALYDEINSKVYDRAFYNFFYQLTLIK